MDRVTSIETAGKHYKLTINDSETRYLTQRQYRQRGLTVGSELSLSAFDDELLTDQYPYALDCAVRALALRPRSRGEIEAALRRKRIAQMTIDMVVYKLEKERFLNDEAFAGGWAEARTNRQVGKARIRQELRQKGVDAELIEAACANVDEDAAREAALALSRKLVKRYQGDEPRKAMEKAVASMIRRGYGYKEATEALKSALTEG